MVDAVCLSKMSVGSPGRVSDGHKMLGRKSSGIGPVDHGEDETAEYSRGVCQVWWQGSHTVCMILGRS